MRKESASSSMQAAVCTFTNLPNLICMKRLLTLPKVCASMLVLFAFIFSGTVFGQGTVSATVITDKQDYYPGEVLHISGTGWLPGETVKLFITETPTLCPNG